MLHTTLLTNIVDPKSSSPVAFNAGGLQFVSSHVCLFPVVSPCHHHPILLHSQCELGVVVLSGQRESTEGASMMKHFIVGFFWAET